MRVTKRVLASLLLVGSLALCIPPRQASRAGSGQSVFQFWYDPWRPDATLKKMREATVIIGAPPSAVAEIHKNGRRALRYVTYYQQVLNHPFLKDRQDLVNVGFQADGKFEKSAFGGEDNYVLCPNSVELKARVLRFLNTSLQQGFDGYFVDNTFLEPAASQVCTAPHAHIKPGATGWQAYLNLLAAVREKLKQKKPDSILITNPGNPASAERDASQEPTLWDVSDYVLWESYGFTSYRGPRHDRWKSTIEQSFTYEAKPERRAKLLVLSYPEDVTEARFSFAVARIFGFKWTANLGDSLQNTAKEGGDFGAFLNDIPQDLGEPVGSLPDKTNPMLHRMFQYGEVFANSGKSPLSISIPKASQVYMADQIMETSVARTLTLAPMTAAIVIKKP